MKFSKIIGEIDSALVSKCEERMTKQLLNLGLRYDQKSVGMGVGGDPFLFNLIAPVEHILTRTLFGSPITTAATNVKSYFYNPEFIMKLSDYGLRIVMSHEAFHCVFMHPTRIGSRNPRLWNIAVDYRVNVTIMEDIASRQFCPNNDVIAFFRKELGEFIKLEEYASFLRDPYHPPARFSHWAPDYKPDPNKMGKDEERSVFFSDTSLPEDKKRPEAIYEYLYKCIPRCPVCNKMGMYKIPDDVKRRREQDKENKSKEKDQGQDQNQNQGQDQNQSSNHGNSSGDNPGGNSGSNPSCGHNHGGNQNCGHNSGSNQGNSSGQDSESDDNQQGSGKNKDNCDCNSGCKNGCDCNGDDYEYLDIGSYGDTFDIHLTADASQEEIDDMISRATASARQMGGTIPGAFEDELADLQEPVVTWQDFVRETRSKIRLGHGKSDWTRFRSRQMAAGVLSPKKKTHHIKFLFGQDCSGSMSDEDVAFGLSQLQVIDENGEGILVPWDVDPYWDKAVKIKNAKVEELKKFKVVGRGGTDVSKFLNEFEAKFGQQDLIIIATDGYLCDSELLYVKKPKCPVMWLITSHNDGFKPPFGKVFHLYNE